MQHRRWESCGFGRRFCPSGGIGCTTRRALDRWRPKVSTRHKAPQELADTMHGAWVNFIKTGIPRHSHLPDWSAYETSKRLTMRFDVESRVVEDIDNFARELWRKVPY